MKTIDEKNDAKREYMVHAKLNHLHFIGAIVVVILTATISWAQQPVHSVQELQSKLKADDELKVIDRNGKTSEGRLVVISASALTLDVRGVHQQFPEAAIREVKIRRPHGGKPHFLVQPLAAWQEEPHLRPRILAPIARIRSLRP